MFCTKCGNELKKGAKFCSSCGTAVSGKSRNKKSKKQSGSGVTIPMPALIIGAVLIVFLGFLVFRQPGSSGDAAKSGGVSPQLQAQMTQVAQNFTCFCGDCNDNLAECACNMPKGATEVKRFILTGLQQGKTVEQMQQAVAVKYQSG